jgi:hypothetical protein
MGVSAFRTKEKIEHFVQGLGKVEKELKLCQKVLML